MLTFCLWESVLTQRMGREPIIWVCICIKLSMVIQCYNLMQMQMLTLVWMRLKILIVKYLWQESIPVGCVPYPPGYPTPRKDMGPEIPYPPQRTWNQGQEGTWHQRYPTPPSPMNRQTSVKTLPSRNYCCGGKILTFHTRQWGRIRRLQYYCGSVHAHKVEVCVPVNVPTATLELHRQFLSGTS